MANYDKILELRPEVGEFIQTQLTRREGGAGVCYRGEVMAYAANMRFDGFSTDSGGFRHSTFGGKSYSVAECLTSDRYGLMLGASHTFGFGLAGNENTIASLLAERFGFPFANASMPGANSRTLHSLLAAFLARAPKPPAVVIFSCGGDLATFCASGLADPVFGSPNRGQLKSVLKDQPLPSDPEPGFPQVVAFTALWTSVIASLCSAYRVPLLLGQQATFFEKTDPTDIERACSLGEPFSDSRARLFANHRKFNRPYTQKRKAIADRRGLPIAGWGLEDKLTFIDEFHCDRDGTRLMSKTIGDVVETLLPVKVPA